MKKRFLLPLFLILGIVACGNRPTSDPITDSETAVESVTVGDGTTTDGHNIHMETTRFPTDKYADLEIVTLLPRDAIPAIDNPRFLEMQDADDAYEPDELVIGVTFNGEARAYSVPFLSSHEIVNDTVGGVKLAVTW